MTGVLTKMMEAALQSEISSSIEEVTEVRRGSITMFRLIAQRTMDRNEEAKTAMLAYVTEFDIRNVDGQHVPTAALRLRAICRSLGSDVPPNAVRCVLDGMKHANNDAFKCICETNSALLSNSLYQGTVATLLTQKHLFSILSDLETKYTKLVQSKKWDGVGHEASTFKASLASGDWDDYQEARICAALKGDKLPFDEWVKGATCHGCGKVGHIRLHCPGKKPGGSSVPRSGDRLLRPRHTSSGSGNRRSQPGDSRNLRSRKGTIDSRNSRSMNGTADPTKSKKALRALQALVEMIGGADGGDSGDDSTGSGGDDDDVDDDASASNDSTSEHAKTALMDGLLDVFEMSKG